MEKLKVFEKAVEYLEDEGYEANVRPNYSGRGMYGRETVGIVTDAPGSVVGSIVSRAFIELFMYDSDNTAENMQDFAENMQDFLEDELVRMVPKSMDSMGLDKIYY